MSVVSHSDNAQGEEFIVSFTVRYRGNYFLVNEDRERDLPLISRTQRAVYVRPRGADRYDLVAQRSTITTREIRTVFNIDTLSCKDFLALNIEDLTKIASSSETFVREWLTRYVQQCESSPERSRLLDLLAR